jgi:hypothetical protein
MIPLPSPTDPRLSPAVPGVPLKGSGPCKAEWQSGRCCVCSRAAAAPQRAPQSAPDASTRRRGCRVGNLPPPPLYSAPTSLPSPPSGSSSMPLPLDDHPTPSRPVHQAGLVDLNPGWTLMRWTDASSRRLIATEYRWFLAAYDAYPSYIQARRWHRCRRRLRAARRAPAQPARPRIRPCMRPTCPTASRTQPTSSLCRFAIAPAQRSDAARYFIVYHYGGVYLDLDYECSRPFAPVLAGARAIFSFKVGTNASRGLANAIFATEVSRGRKEGGWAWRAGLGGGTPKWALGERPLMLHKGEQRRRIRTPLLTCTVSVPRPTCWRAPLACPSPGAPPRLAGRV